MPILVAQCDVCGAVHDRVRKHWDEVYYCPGCFKIMQVCDIENEYIARINRLVDRIEREKTEMLQRMREVIGEP